MHRQTPPIIDPRHLVEILLRYRWRWIVPTAVLALAALGYACLKCSKWQARQALVVRDEAVGSYLRPGKFDSTEDMKTAQETVLELAKSRSVVSAALGEVGPATGAASPGFPTVEDVESIQKAIEVSAPNGAEFGHTEVFYLKLTDKDPRRAVALTTAICDQLDLRLRELRDHKAQSLVAELDQTVQLARRDLANATRQLAEMERQAGADLGELRLLNESTTGESNLRQTLIEITNELRQAERAARTSQQLQALLRAAQADPDCLIATPNDLLTSQPALRQLKDGLIAAQLQTATLLGSMSPEHPKVRAAVAAEEQIRTNLHAELKLAIVGLEAERKLGQSQAEVLTKQAEEIRQRMQRLAAIRADYANLVAEVARRTEAVTRSEEELGQARASLAAAHTTSLMTRLDGPIVPDSPLGPSRSSIVLIGLAGGLISGLGLVFLTAPVSVFPAEAAASQSRPEANGKAESTSPRRPHQPVAERLTPLHGLSLTEALKRIAAAAPSWN
jgi:succinoglycan biosynthesis transport protein ExoP